MSDHMATQREVEAQLEWALYHARAALRLQGWEQPRLNYQLRQQLREVLPQLRDLIDAAEENYRKDAA